jgi:hypothetical protein
MEQAGNYRQYKTVFLVLTVAIFAWGVIGALDITNIPYAGYTLSPDNSVIVVREESPAAQAGLRVGDTVTKIDDIAIENFGALTTRERPAVGSAGSITVKRGDAEETLSVTYGQQPQIDVITQYGWMTLTGLAFLLLGLMVYLKNPTRLSTTFCWMSLLFAVALFNSPYLTTSIQRRLVGAIQMVLVAILFGLILDYSLSFPKTKRIIENRRWLRQAIYAVVGAWGVSMATITLTTPPMSVTRTQLLSLSFGLIIGGYLLLSVIAVVHSYVTATAEQRTATGMNLMLGGMVIGFVPILVAIILRTISPSMGELPGERFYAMTLIAIPIGLAMALMKLERVGVEVKAEEGATSER